MFDVYLKVVITISLWSTSSLPAEYLVSSRRSGSRGSRQQAGGWSRSSVSQWRLITMGLASTGKWCTGWSSDCLSPISSKGRDNLWILYLNSTVELAWYSLNTSYIDDKMTGTGWCRSVGMREIRGLTQDFSSASSVSTAYCNYN